jgi:hypothetical protein
VAQTTDPLPSESLPTSAPPAGKQGPSAKNRDSLSGFSGWLILLVLSLVILSPLETTIGVAATISDHTTWFTDPLGSIEVAGPIVYWVLIETASVIGLMCYGIYAGLKLLKIRPGAVRTTKIFLIAVFVYNLGVFVITLVADHRGDTRMDDLVAAELRNVVFALFWWAYLETSDRVAATYSDPKS